MKILRSTVGKTTIQHQIKEHHFRATLGDIKASIGGFAKLGTPPNHGSPKMNDPQNSNSHGLPEHQFQGNSKWELETNYMGVS